MILLQVLKRRMPLWSAADAVFFAAGAVFLLILFRRLKFRRFQYAAGAALYIWTFNVLVTTLLMREQAEDYRYDLRIFYQLKVGFTDGNSYALCELALNFLMLVPVGLLLPLLLKTRKRFIISALCGAGLSAFIELTQLFLRLGEFQLDDLAANSLGAFAGSVLSCCIYIRINRRENLQKVNKTA